MFSKRKYVRSIEEVQLSSSSALFLFLFFRARLITLNFFGIGDHSSGLTIAEALSPHTWDDPLMIIVGSLSIFPSKD